MSVNKRTSYSKICVACNEPFIAKRISTLYCSKKCANVARSMPDSLKVALIKRNNAYILKSEVVAAHLAGGQTETYVKTHIPSQLDNTLGIKNASKENPAGDDLGLLIEMGKQEAIKRGLKPIDVKPQDMLLEVGDGPNKVEFVLNVDNTPPDPDDDGLNGPPLDIKPSGDKENKVDNSNNQPSANTVHKGIRKIGSK